jgi:glutaminyl-tRNA synthetase
VYDYSSPKYPKLPKQREFARLNLNYTIMSKRKLLTLVEQGAVSGWDDPRMPTISGLRRRGYTPKSIKKFINSVGVAKRDNIIDVSLLEFCVREDLNKSAPRIMAVLDPVKLIITNYQNDKTELLDAENNPEDPKSGSRQLPFSKTLYIERDDFKEQANNKYFRLTIGKEVRLKNAYIIKAESVVKDEKGKIQEIHCTYDSKSLSGSGTEESLRKVKGTLHWVSAAHAIEAEVREYDRLFSHEAPDSQEEGFMTFLNPSSLNQITAFVEPNISNVQPNDHFQFQRIGYFCVDKDSTQTKVVFNKTVGLRDSWEKQKPKAKVYPKPNNQKHERKPIDVVKQLGKKYTNLPEDKQLKIKTEIIQLSTGVLYEELEPLFGTATKKVGTRIAVMIVLKELLKKGQDRNQQIDEFIEKASTDSNELLRKEALTS